MVIDIIFHNSRNLVILIMLQEGGVIEIHVRWWWWWWNGALWRLEITLVVAGGRWWSLKVNKLKSWNNNNTGNRVHGYAGTADDCSL